MIGRARELTSGRLLAGNVSVNLIGWVLPAVAALVAIPALIRGMGPERFGLLALAWTLVGYFSVFDLGIGRALTQVLAERVGAADERESPALTWTALWLLAPLGVVCAFALGAAAVPLGHRVLNVPPALQQETSEALRLLALAVPAMVLTSGLRAVLEAGQHFRTINVLRVPLGLVTFLGPLAVQRVSHGLTASVAVLVAARVVMLVLHAVVVLRLVPRLRRPRRPTRAALQRLWGIAGWITVSSIISPVLVSVDRFVIGAVLPLTAVAHYATSSEIATKLWLFTAALQPVVFPALAATIAHEPARAAVLFDRGVRVTFLALLLPAAALVLVAPEGLSMWLGPEFARHGTPLLRGLAIAVFLNALGQMPYGVLQAAGRADLPGKLHVVELPLYLATLWALLTGVGTPGVALAWLLRMGLDAWAQFLMVRRVLPAARDSVRRALVLMLVGGVALGVCALPESLVARLSLGAALAVGVATLGWRLLAPGERASSAAWARALLPARRIDERALPRG